jgi:glycine/D-amino acid oxidase-like deaminating enzyme
VAVIGGGISGITTALVLQAAGLKVTIFAEHVPLQAAGATSLPVIATGSAMASAYPHNLRVANLDRISAESQQVFALLHDDIRSAIQIYRIFEVYEHEPPPPPLAEQRLNFRSFDGTASTLTSVDPPIRPGADHVWGWVFDTYFADMPRYLAFLWAVFSESGGKFQSGKVDPSDLHTCSGPIINCTGYGALTLLSDDAPFTIVRGKQVLVPGAPVLRAGDGALVAYNYTPSADIFSRGDGQPEYVHFFAREDGWILGQTREPGKLDANGSWLGDEVKSPRVIIGDCSIPTPVIELNKQLLRTWMNCDLDETGLIAREGYRYYRDPAGGGVRLEVERIGNALIIHNYGHGGSGIAMSWGCALECARLALRECILQETSQFARASRLQELLRSLV